jgi:hypothetical protein
MVLQTKRIIKQWCGKHFAAPTLADRLMTVISDLEGAETETELFKDGGQNKRQKDIYVHCPKHIQIICHLPDPSSFSLPTTFNSKDGVCF